MFHCNFSSSLTYGTFKLWPSCTQIICHMMTWTILQHLQAKHTVASWLYSYLNLFLRNFICRLGASPSDLRSFDIDNHIAVWGWEVLNLSWLMRTMLAYNMHKASEQKQWLSIQAVLSFEPHCSLVWRLAADWNRFQVGGGYLELYMLRFCKVCFSLLGDSACGFLGSAKHCASSLVILRCRTELWCMPWLRRCVSVWTLLL